MAACIVRDDPRLLARMAFGITSPRLTLNRWSTAHPLFGSMVNVDFNALVEVFDKECKKAGYVNADPPPPPAKTAQKRTYNQYSSSSRGSSGGSSYHRGGSRGGGNSTSTGRHSGMLFSSDTTGPFRALCLGSVLVSQTPSVTTPV